MKQAHRSKYSAIKSIVLEYITDGASTSAVGRDSATPQPTVRRWAQQAGIEIQHQSHYPKVSMQRKRRVIYEMLMTGTYSVA